MALFTRAFWRDAGIRAGRTVLVAAIPLLAPIMTGTTETLLQALAALALAALFSVVTSLVSLPEAGAGRSRWAALVDRGVRSAAQVAAAALAAAALWSDVDWRALGAQALVAGLTSVMLGIVDTLPEVDAPPTPVPDGGTPPVGTAYIRVVPQIDEETLALLSADLSRRVGLPEQASTGEQPDPANPDSGPPSPTS